MNIPRSNRAASNASGQRSAMRVVSLRTGEALLAHVTRQESTRSGWCWVDHRYSLNVFSLAHGKAVLHIPATQLAQCVSACSLTRTAIVKSSQQGCRCPLGHML